MVCYFLSSTHIFAVLVSVLWTRLQSINNNQNLDVRNIFAVSHTKQWWGRGCSNITNMQDWTLQGERLFVEILVKYEVDITKNKP
jgi:hypothetical protein